MAAGAGQPAAAATAAQVLSPATFQPAETCLSIVKRLRTHLQQLLSTTADGMQMDHQAGEHKKHFLEQLKRNVDAIKNDWTLFITASSRVHFRLTDDHMPIVQSAASTDPTVYHAYHRAARSVAECERLESDAAALLDAIHSLEPKMAARRNLKPPMPQSSDKLKIPKMENKTNVSGKSSIFWDFSNVAALGFVNITIENIASFFVYIDKFEVTVINVLSVSELSGNIEEDSRKSSKYVVMTILSGVIHSAFLYFYRQFHPVTNETAVFSTLKIIRFYSNLFTDKCGECGKHVLNGLPPLVLDLKHISERADSSEQPKFHVECVPHNI